MSLLELTSVSPTRRRAIRRAVRLECHVSSRYWGEPVPHQISDLSPYGCWIDTPFPLAHGERVVVSLSVPTWQRLAPMEIVAEVVRVSLRRRATETRTSGMGLQFVNLSSDDIIELAFALHGVPPRLPTQAPTPSEPLERAYVRTALAEEPSVTQEIRFHALAPLLTGASEAAVL